jgi:hypothetical protein
MDRRDSLAERTEFELPGDFVSSQSAIKTHQHRQSTIPDADGAAENEHSRLYRTLAVGE